MWAAYSPAAQFHWDLASTAAALAVPAGHRELGVRAPRGTRIRVVVGGIHAFLGCTAAVIPPHTPGAGLSTPWPTNDRGARSGQTHSLEREPQEGAQRAAAPRGSSRLALPWSPDDRIEALWRRQGARLRPLPRHGSRQGPARAVSAFRAWATASGAACLGGLEIHRPSFPCHRRFPVGSRRERTTVLGHQAASGVKRNPPRCLGRSARPSAPVRQSAVRISQRVHAPGHQTLAFGAAEAQERLAGQGLLPDLPGTVPAPRVRLASC